MQVKIVTYIFVLIVLMTQIYLKLYTSFIELVSIS